MDTNHPFIQLASIPGVWNSIFPISGWSAMERGATSVQPIDVVKAIYIVDLEHVASYWDNWLNYESLVSNIMLSDGRKTGYVNRVQRFLLAQLAGRENPGELVPFAPPSPLVVEIVFAARKLATSRNGDDEDGPSSCDLLYCICLSDTIMGETLQRSGLQFTKLAAAVR
jgi:hypothetical protein